MTYAAHLFYLVEQGCGRLLLTGIERRILDETLLSGLVGYGRNRYAAWLLARSLQFDDLSLETWPELVLLEFQVVVRLQVDPESL